jgi:predicted Zn-dependent protease
MNRIEEAKKLMQEAVPMGAMLEVHYYGRQLVSMKENAEAFRIFKANYDKNPNVFTTNVGMARGYSATGDFKKALTFAKAALAQAPDERNKSNVEAMISKLQESKDVN